MKIPVLLSLAIPCFLGSCSRTTTAESAEFKANSDSPVKVTITRAITSPVPRYLQITGELKGGQQANVAADATGKVIESRIERGTIVKKGDVLFRLDARGATLSLAEAEANLVAARLKLDLQRGEFARNEPLARTKAISDTDFQRFKVDFSSAEAEAAAAEAKRDLAQKTLSDSTIISPFDATVNERLIEIGEYVNPNTQVAAIVSTNPLRFVVYVPETDVGRVKIDQSVTFSVPAYPGETFNGLIKFIGATVRSSARDLVVEAEVENHKGRLKPGMFAEGRIDLGDVESITAPKEAVKKDNLSSRVFVYAQGKLEERLIEVGETRDGRVEIRKGVSEGESLVLNPEAGSVDGATADASETK